MARSSFADAVPASRSDVLRRIRFTIGAVILYEAMRCIPLPGIDPSQLETVYAVRISDPKDWLHVSAFGFADRVSISAVDLWPYLFALTTVRLLAPFLPGLEPTQDGERAFRRRFGRYVRSATCVYALLYSLTYAVDLNDAADLVKDPGAAFVITTTLTLTASALFLAWLAARMTERGIASGLLVLLAVTWICEVPAQIDRAFATVMLGERPAWVLLAAGVGLVAQVALVVVMEGARRRIVLAFPPENEGATKAPRAPIVLPVNASGVLPAVFAYAILGAVAFLPEGWGAFARSLDSGRPLETIASSLLIVAFTFYLTAMTFAPADAARTVAQGGGLIPGVPSGEQTAAHLDAVATRLTALAAAYLCALYVGPAAIAAWSGLPFGLGGYGLLIVTFVAIDILAQVRGMRADA